MGWPIGITLILAATVGANIWLVVTAGGVPSFAIEPDYYAKAVAYDSTLAQDQRNVALGWRIVPTLDGFSIKDGARLTVAVTDSAGQPITEALVRVSALFNGRASQILEATLAPTANGYAARLPVNHRGQWELRFDIHRGNDHFTATTRVDAEPAETRVSQGPPASLHPVR